MQSHGRLNSKLIGKTILIFVSAFQLLYSASVEATVSATEVVQDNVVQLRIVATGNRAAFPSIQEIGGNRVVGKNQSQSNSFSYINGATSSIHTTTLTLTFMPKYDMTIPSYRVNIDGAEYKTNPIDIKVIKSNAPQVSNSNKFSLLMRAEKKSVMVGESFIATVFFSLQNGVRLSENPQYDKPEFKGFFVKEVKQENVYREGSRQITELKYILTPKSEGNYTLEPATAKIGVADTSRQDIFGRFFATAWTSIASNTLNIEVKPKPKNITLVGSFTIQNSIDNEKVKANKPVNLTIKIEGNGSLEDFEFPSYEIDGVTIYSDDAKVETQIIGGKLKSTYIKSFVFIGENTFAIPARSISVHDTSKGVEKSLEISKYKIEIEPKKSVVSALSPNNTFKREAIQTNLNQADTILKNSAVTKRAESTNISWWMLLIAFIFGVIFMYLWQLVPTWHRKQSPFKESEALKILYAHIDEDKEIEAMVRKLYAKKNGDKGIQIDKKLLKKMIEQVQSKTIVKK